MPQGSNLKIAIFENESALSFGQKRLFSIDLALLNNLLKAIERPVNLFTTLITR